MRTGNYAVASCWLIVLWLGLHNRDATAQDRSLSTAAHGATAQERLLMEQIDQLAGAGQVNEALASLKRLVDNSQGRLIELGPIQKAATLSVQLHQPISDWAQWRLFAWSERYSEQLKSAVRTDEQLANRALEDEGTNLQATSLLDLSKRTTLAPSATEARLWLCDLYLDRGWTIAARQALNAPGTDVRAYPLGSNMAPGTGLPWFHVWPRLKSTQEVQQLLDGTWQSVQAPYSQSVDELRLQILKRLLTIGALDDQPRDAPRNAEWVSKLAERLPPPQRSEFDRALRQTRQWSQTRSIDSDSVAKNYQTFAGTSARTGSSITTRSVSEGPSITTRRVSEGSTDASQRVSEGPSQHASNQGQLELGSWPKWSKAVERVTGQFDRNPASKPPVAEGGNGILPYYPTVYDGKVFIHELTRITAYDAATGKPWPATEPALPLYDTGTSIATYFPFGYNLIGSPRGTVTIADDRLYARMGPPVTGWAGRVPTNETLSLSSIVALDLKRQGSMRAGFPVRLHMDEFPHSEFEGAPVVIDRQVLVCVLARDNVNLRRYVVSLDRDTGAVLWRSPMLASGMVSGAEQASLVSHQLLSVAGGRIYVNTNLGAIACLNLENGQIVWLARYQRALATAEEPYARPDRFRYRDLTPCMVLGSQVVCAPQDCPELFALDAVSGQLLWSTEAERVDDANHMLGAVDEDLIVSGDRIYWLDTDTGKVQAAFPGSGVGEVSTALPTPRGYGRGIIVGDRVYWPTQNEIFIFDARQDSTTASDAPTIRGRIRLDTKGAEGGNLIQLGQSLMIAAPGRIFVFDQ